MALISIKIDAFRIAILFKSDPIYRKKCIKPSSFSHTQQPEYCQYFEWMWVYLKITNTKKNIIGFLKHLQCIHRQSVNKQSVESIQFKCLLFFGLALFYVTVCCTINRIMQRYTQVNLIRHANIIRMTIVLGMLPKSRSKYNGK